MSNGMYQVLHRRRIVTIAGACNVLAHNLRLGMRGSESSVINEDVAEIAIPDYMNREYMGLNTYLGSQTTSDFCINYQKKIDDAKLMRKPQRNASKIVETVFSSSHSFCEDWKINPEAKKIMEQYLNDGVEWELKLRGDVTLSVVIHWDESTPHIHVLSLPLVEYKEENSNEIKLKFSSSEFFGNIGDLKKLHTDYHTGVSKKYGLERGVSGSRASHKELRDYKSWEKEQRYKFAEKEIFLEKEILKSKLSTDKNKEHEAALINREVTIVAREKELKQREWKASYSEHVVDAKQDMFDRSVVRVNQNIPSIPKPPATLNQKKIQSWVDVVQDAVTKAFKQLNTAYETLLKKYQQSILEVTGLRKWNKELKNENAIIKNELLNKPFEDIKVYREQYFQQSKMSILERGARLKKEKGLSR